MPQNVKDWWQALPPVTRTLISFVFAETLLSTLSLVSPRLLLLQWPPISQQLQVWRLGTCFFFFGVLAGPGAFNVVVNIYLFLTYSQRLEDSQFRGKPADYCFLIIFVCIAMVISGLLIGLPVLSGSILLAVIWIWCRRNPDQPLSIMGFFEVNAVVFPWVLTGIHWAFGQGFIPDLVGIAAGHLYIFLKDILPRTHIWDLLQTPAILRQYLPDQRFMGGVATFTPMSRAPAPPPKPAGHQWGPGRTLSGTAPSS
eukprot:TRINITY_DN31179_c0_g1_i1.p1 TRINITY_DN31179_c0_g1~~TRINITY_DN31179_c0_g1_i1.p1  ORF type:complete len:264 (-),score=36.48 TRINITY_DN31179_c0_g1_i1:24-788(-)